MEKKKEIFPYIAKLLNGEKVQYKTLGEVAELKRGNSITKKTSNQGEIPVISGGQQPAYYIDQFNRKGNTITVAGSGAYAGHVMYWEEPIFVGDAFSVKTDETILSTKYVYHFLLQNQQKIYAMKKGSGVPHVYPKDLGVLQIPLPPLSVQQEIVRILDKFTQLEAELEAELDCRKRQYEYYRDNLLADDKKVQYKTLGEVADFQNGFAFKSRSFRDNGEVIVRITNIDGKGVDLSDVKYFSISDYNTNMSPYKINKGDILIAMSGATTGKIGFYNYEYTSYINQRVGKFIPKANILNNRYLYHYLLSKVEEIYIIAGGGAQPNLSSNKLMEKIQIPIPPIEEQQRIAGILDKFDTLVNSISEGLPREIALRRKQYEYYRERLMTFPEN